MDAARIAVIDDHPPLREGIVAILERTPDFSVVGEAGSLAEALALVATEELDLVIVDITLPDGSGIDLIRKISATRPQVRVLVLTMHASRQLVDAAFEAGARGYLLKESGAEVLLSGLRDILDGSTVIDTALKLPDPDSGCSEVQSERMGLELLTPRELEVFTHLAVGQNSREIAHLLDISAKTVDNHRSSVMEKLCIRSIADIVRIAIRTGVIDP